MKRNIQFVFNDLNVDALLDAVALQHLHDAVPHAARGHAYDSEAFDCLGAGILRNDILADLHVAHCVINISF